MFLSKKKLKNLIGTRGPSPLHGRFSKKFPFCFSEYLPYTLPRYIEYCKETNFTQAVPMVEEVSNSITGANPLEF